jgi:hypothetical protein
MVTQTNRLSPESAAYVCGTFSFLGASIGAAVVLIKSRYSESHLDKATNVALYLPGAITSVAASVFLSIALSKTQKGRDLTIPEVVLNAASAFAPYFAGTLHMQWVKYQLRPALKNVPTEYIRWVFGAIGAASTLLVTTIASRILTGSFAVTTIHIGLALTVAFLYSRLNKLDFGPALNWLAQNKLSWSTSKTVPGWIKGLALRFPEEFGGALGRLQNKYGFHYLQGVLFSRTFIELINELGLDEESSKKFGRGYALVLDRVYQSIIKPRLHPMAQFENIITVGKTQELCGNRIVEAMASTLAFKPKGKALTTVAIQANHLCKELIHQICIWLKPTDIIQLSMTSKWHYYCIAGPEGLPMWNAKKLDLMREIFLSKVTDNQNIGWIQAALVRASPHDLLPDLKTCFTDGSPAFIMCDLRDRPENLRNPEYLKDLSPAAWQGLIRLGLPEEALEPFCAGITELHNNHFGTVDPFTTMIPTLRRIRSDYPHFNYRSKVPVDLWPIQ